MQLRHGPLRFFDREHLHKGETFRALIMFVGHDLGVLHLADAIEEFEKIALRRFERKVADVKPRRGYFDAFRLTRSAWRLTIAETSIVARLFEPRFWRISVREKSRNLLPERFFRRSFGSC